jgi:hypothetical protein
MPNAPSRKILATYRPRGSFSVVSGPGQPFRAENVPTAILESRLGGAACKQDEPKPDRTTLLSKVLLLCLGRD